MLFQRIKEHVNIVAQGRDRRFRHRLVPALRITLRLEVADDDTGATTRTFEFVVYDPSGSFVTGGGWIDSPAGAYVADPSLTGMASFGFVSKYKKGAEVPAGQTQFQ